MADFNLAIPFTLAHEGGYFFNPVTGECVNRGLTHWFLRGVGFLAPLPRSVPATDAEKLIVQNLSLATTDTLYYVYFWKPNRCGEIQDQNVAAKFFDLCVNTGSQEACLILQRAIHQAIPLDEQHFTLASAVTTDGEIGPKTLAAANVCDPAALMAAIRSEGSSFYDEVGQQDAAKWPPSEVAAWKARLNS